MPECALCEDDVPRSESRLPFRSHDNTVSLAHTGCEEGEKLPFLLRENGTKRAAHVCEACEDDVDVRRVQVTGAHSETEFRKQFRCPACEGWARLDDGA